MLRVRLVLPLLLAIGCRQTGAPATSRAPATVAATPSCPPGPRSATGEQQLAGPEQQRRLRGLAALDAGRFDLARAEFAAILAVAPDNFAARALLDAATRALLDSQRQAAESFADAVPIVLPAPPWQHTVAREVALAVGGPPAQLVQRSMEPNRGTDEAAWFRRHGLRLPEYEVPNPMRGLPGDLPPAIPPAHGTHLLVQAIAHPDHTILIYGPSYSGGRLVAVLDAQGRRIAFLDFAAYQLAPGVDPGAAAAQQHILWAEVQDGVLHVSHDADDARASKGRSAYVTAVDVATGALRWRSEPGVAGAANFALHAGHLFTGHGAPGEPARLFVLDRRTGRTVATASLAGAPEYLFVQGGTLLVRTLEADHAFELRRNRAG